MKAYMKRFDGTIRESFVDCHQDLLFTEIELFNLNLVPRLIF